MRSDDPSSQFLERLRLVTGKRSKIVVEHILEHGFITTEDLEQTYGYKHPPRAVKDVRDQGIPIDTYRVKSSDGRTIAAYRFGDPSKVREGRFGGRTAFSRSFKRELHEQLGKKCGLCNGDFLLRSLQIDHRIPYEIAGDTNFSAENIASYMLLCGSCNRAKSWTCEHCPNWQKRDPTVCRSCYWAYPTAYSHVATKDVRRAEIIWQGDESRMHDELLERASQSKKSVQTYIKDLLKNIFATVIKLLTFLF